MILIKNHNLFHKLIKLSQEAKTTLIFSRFVFITKTEDGYLLWNSLTNALVILNCRINELLSSEIKNLNEIKELVKNSMLVPSDFEEYKQFLELRKLLKNVKKTKHLNSYTIFTTLNCNARCFYCFENGMPKLPMIEFTALDAVRFIHNTSKGEKIGLHWFGGEPLVNVKIIDLISSELRKLGIEFKSDMISNGYLFEAEIIRRAVDLWNLKKVQITLDGTEEVYNKTKAYDIAKGSPYKRVLDNINLLLTAGIAVNVRLNLSLENASDLLTLADELSERFGSQRKFSVYARLLYEYEENTPEETQKVLIDAYEKLIKKLYELRLYKKKLPERLRLNHCMADSDNSYTILPNGKLGKCEHFGDSNYVGDIWNGVTDEALVAKFKERETHERCKECLFAPSCTLLKMCFTNCNDLYIATKKIDLKYSMLAAYRKWKEENKEKEYETEPRI